MKKLLLSVAILVGATLILSQDNSEDLINLCYKVKDAVMKEYGVDLEFELVILQ